MRNKRVFLDTQVYSYLADGRVDTNKWKRALRSRKSICVLSAITLLELLDGLVKAPSHIEFKKQQQALGLVWEFGGRDAQRVLMFPGSFARKNAFRVEGTMGRFTPNDFRKWLYIAIMAWDKDQLVRGEVETSSSQTRTFGLDPAVISGQLTQGRQIYVEQLSQFATQLKPDYWELRKTGQQIELTPAELRALDTYLNGAAVRKGFVDGLRKNLGLSALADERIPPVDEIIDSLDAVFTFRCFMFRQVLTSNYRFEMDASAYYDMQQLFYLCDPDFVFVTDDRRLRHAITKSKQVDRVMGTDEFASVLSTL